MVRIACLMLVVAAGPARAMDAFELQGRGVQVYTCAAADGGFAWRLKAPDAVLFDAQGREAGRHFAGPSWQAPDGSVVVGEVAASSGGGAGAIPWLVLRAKSHEGAGVFATVQAIVRSRTEGGVAPPGGCDSERNGQETRVEYRAAYTFFPG